MNLNEAIAYLEQNIGQMACEWEPDDLAAVSVLLDAVRMRPVTEPPDTNRWVLVKHNGPSGEEEWDRGYYDARPNVEKFYIREGDNCDPIGWRELPE